MEQVNEHAASFGSVKSGVVIPLGFPVMPGENLLVTISNRGGQTAETEWECVKFEGFTVPGTSQVDMVYILKPLTPFVIEGRKK
jgi:hypothetical protein